MGAAAATKHVAGLPVPVHVHAVRAPQGVPDPAPAVLAARGGAAEPGAHPHQCASRGQPHPRVSPTRPAGAVHVSCRSRGS